MEEYNYRVQTSVIINRDAF